MTIRKTLRRIRDFYCYADFYISRGLDMTNSIYQVIKYTAFAGIIVGMINEAFKDFELHWWVINLHFNIHIPMDRVIIFTPLLVICLAFLGILDVKGIHLLQKRNELVIRTNPYLEKIIRNKE